MEFLYIVRQGDSNDIKFGRSYQPLHRLKQMQTSNSNKLILIDTYECRDCVTLELIVHRHLKDTKLNGEWFCLNANELTNTIEFICKQIEEMHEALDKNKCDICNFYAHDNIKYMQHMKSLSHKNKYETMQSKQKQQCSQTFTKVVDGLKYACDRCNYSTNNKVDYNKHMIVPHKTNEKINDTIYQQSNEKKKCSQIVTKPIQNDSTFICNYCTYNTYDKSNYNRHIKSQSHITQKEIAELAHSNVPENLNKPPENNIYKFICSFCNMKFTRSSNLTRHKNKCVDLKIKSELDKHQAQLDNQQVQFEIRQLELRAEHLEKINKELKRLYNPIYDDLDD